MTNFVTISPSTVTLGAGTARTAVFLVTGVGAGTSTLTATNGSASFMSSVTATP